MTTLRKSPSWLPRKLEGLVFSVFALVWTASLGGCQSTDPSDSLGGRYGCLSVEDTLQSDSVVAKYGVVQPADDIVVRYGSPPPPTDSIKPVYGTSSVEKRR